MRPGFAKIIQKVCISTDLQVLKQTIILQRLLPVLIILSPGCCNGFIDCQKATVHVVGLPIIAVNIQRNSTLLLY